MNGVERIAAERQRQIEVEGWTPDYDDGHDTGDLAHAAVAYIKVTLDPQGTTITPGYWPWLKSWWKPGDPIRNLEKAGALIAAEIDRLLRREVTVK